MSERVTIVYSDAVRAFAAEQEDGLNGLQQAVDTGIRELLVKDLSPESILDVFFHTISWHGEYNIILVPIDDTLTVDVTEWESFEMLPTDGGVPFTIETPVSR